MHQNARVVVAVASLFLAPACASHHIRSAEPEPVGIAGQPFIHKSTSIGGRGGVSTDGTGYVTRDECRSADLADVEVRRDFGQTLVTLFTLGFVSPATIYFYCEKQEVPPPCDCGDDDQL